MEWAPLPWAPSSSGRAEGASPDPTAGAPHTYLFMLSRASPPEFLSPAVPSRYLRTEFVQTGCRQAWSCVWLSLYP